MAKQNIKSIGDKILDFIAKPLPPIPGSATAKKIIRNPFGFTAFMGGLLALGILGGAGAPAASAIAWTSWKLIWISGAGTIGGGIWSATTAVNYFKNRKKNKAVAKTRGSRNTKAITTESLAEQLAAVQRLTAEITARNAAHAVPTDKSALTDESAQPGFTAAAKDSAPAQTPAPAAKPAAPKPPQAA